MTFVYVVYVLVCMQCVCGLSYTSNSEYNSYFTFVRTSVNVINYFHYILQNIFELTRILYIKDYEVCIAITA